MKAEFKYISIFHKFMHQMNLLSDCIWVATVIFQRFIQTSPTRGVKTDAKYGFSPFCFFFF